MEETFTYLIQSLKNKEYYTGITKDLVTRLKLHNRGNQKSTSKNRPFKLVYYKRYKNYQEARKHEKWLKKKNREYKDNLVKNFAVVAQLVPPIQTG